MVKTIKIGNQNYIMKSSAWTPFKYKSDYGHDLLKDINFLNKKNREIGKLKKDEQEEAWMDEMSGILEMALHMAYCMLTEYDKTFKPYNEWLGEIDDLLGDEAWILEVMELAMSTFRGRVQNQG